MKKYKLINFCESDEHAVKSYCAIHKVSEDLNLGDITKVKEKEIADFDLMTWGFPCQHISLAGKQDGFVDENGNKTSSGLYEDGIRIFREKKPKISIIENVKNLTSKTFKNEFNQVLTDLNDCGYNTYWKVLNAKHYGIPQGRERVFFVSIRKDIDNELFEFPKELDSNRRLSDFLDDYADEKYYISNEITNKIISEFDEPEIAPQLIPQVMVIVLKY